MGIQSPSEYVNFFINLNMGKGTNLLNFLNNEKRILKLKLGNKSIEKEPLKNGIKILEELVKEINENGEESVLEKYQEWSKGRNMDKNSEIIRIEILRILNENGKIRGNELAKRVIKKVGNEKIVYREISSLVEAGEIDKKVHSRAHIEYELINLDESANEQLKNLHKEIEVVYEEI